MCVTCSWLVTWQVSNHKQLKNVSQILTHSIAEIMTVLWFYQKIIILFVVLFGCSLCDNLIDFIFEIVCICMRCFKPPKETFEVTSLVWFLWKTFKKCGRLQYVVSTATEWFLLWSFRVCARRRSGVSRPKTSPTSFRKCQMIRKNKRL